MINLKALLLIVGLGFITNSFGNHKFYVSISTIDLSRDGEKLECSIKLFKDDLEKALENSFGEKVDFSVEKGSLKIDSLVNAYTKLYFKMSNNEGLLQRTYIGCELAVDVVWIYVEYVRPDTYFKLANTCLMDLYTEQVTIVHFKKRRESSERNV